MASFAAFFPCSTKLVYCKRPLNAGENWQWGYESVHLVAQYSFVLHCLAGLDQTRWCKSIRYPLAANSESGVGPCTGIVNPFKHLLRATAHPQFLVFELRAPMGTCPGQYGSNSWNPACQELQKIFWHKNCFRNNLWACNLKKKYRGACPQTPSATCLRVWLWLYHL